MRNLIKTVWMVITALLLFAACAKEEGEEIQDRTVEGVYSGTLTEVGTKSATAHVGNMEAATSKVTIVGENEIQVHCYTNDFDTTFMLNYFEHNDSAYVCLTGEHFEERYGHMLGGGHMMGGMMGDIRSGETEWQHHMDDEHTEGDEHFGGFDTNHHAFTYTFRMMDGEHHYSLRFEGSKQE